MRFWARAPVRVDPAGGGTDCPPFSVEHGGLVVNFGIARYVHAMFEELPAGQGVLLHSRDRDETWRAASVSGLPTEGGMKFLGAFLKRLVPKCGGCLLVTDSDVPEAAGLGGSAALGVAIAAAVERSKGLEHSAAALAELANSVERNDLESPGGSQDSYGAALGGANRIEYHAGGQTSSRPIRIAPETILRLERDSLLVYTGGAHVSGSIHDDIQKSYARVNSPTLKAMFGLRDEASRMVEALEQGDVPGYAQAMNCCRFHHYALHESCDCDSLRKYFKALEGLILGGKTCGAGGGGFILLCAKPDRRRECLRAAERLGGLVWPMKFDWDGVRAWTEPASTPQEIELLHRTPPRT